MGILVAFLVALVLASIILALSKHQPGKYRHVQLWRALCNVDPMLNRFRSPTPGPREAMENLTREIEETRHRAYRSSHRPRPR